MAATPCTGARDRSADGLSQHVVAAAAEHHPHVHCVVPGGGLCGPAKTSETCRLTGAQAPRWLVLPAQLGLLCRSRFSPVFRGQVPCGLARGLPSANSLFAGTPSLNSPAAWGRIDRALYKKMGSLCQWSLRRA